MSRVNFLDKLLDGVVVEWKALESCATLERGRRVTKSELSPEKKYSVFSGGVTPMGFYDDFNQTKNTITIVKYGTAGFVNFIKTDFWANDVCYCIRPGETLNNKYLFYYLKKQQNEIQSLATDAIPAHLPTEEISTYPIPIPCPDNPQKSLEIQAEIVRILDAFTELTAELTARKKQYNHYRDRLLSFKDGEEEWETLEAITTSIASGRNKDRTAEGAIPVYGSTGLIGFTNEAAYSGDVLLVARVGANAGLVNAVSGSFDVSDNTLIVRPIDAWNFRFAFHQLTHMNLNQYAVGGGQPLVTGGLLKNLQVPFPPLKEQECIAGILDKFDALTNSISEGLPREIELRKKQYEHYRDLLLSFPKPEEVAA